eukprot:CAMPEP_0173087908 /NCGR_PEP_ID=MMETSP1102-20130122/24383_1 /TAXON_ID=49646 /ORGANISM="Geminigera sp., Strain Caron Lab Isolate" /LENGTH=47 /DNA_ID= /DNA_START= /DNA_END= /DNA_ORIENTATION=
MTFGSISNMFAMFHPAKDASADAWIKTACTADPGTSQLQTGPELWCR